jgi:signal transduction histidine kinase
MEPDAEAHVKPSAAPAEPVTKDVSTDVALTPAGAEALSSAVPAEALVQVAPTDDALGPSIATEALEATNAADVLAAAVASDLPPGTVEVPALPPPPASDEDPQVRGSGTGAVILEWPHPVGSVAAWPHSLRAAVSVMLASGFPTLIVWGTEGTQLYNDACRSVLGATKPQAAFGQHSSPCWAEICDTLVDPMFQQVMSGGKPVWIEELMLVVDRSGYFEEAYFTFSCGAIRDETGDPIGMLATFVETTSRVLSERRLRMLGELAGHASSARVADVTCRNIAGTLEQHENDIPFFLLYLVDADGRKARLCASAGVAEEASPQVVSVADSEDGDAVWPIGRVTRTGQAEECADLGSLARSFSGGPWSEDAQTAFAVPILSGAHETAIGVMVAGISPRRVLDEDYRAFLTLVATQIGTALGNARSYEGERQRGDAIAVLDREKTAFFTRITDEFRKPLTLMLGPAGDLLAGAHGRLSGDQREQIAVLHANATHLLKLADTLLAFLRIEAGRIEPSFEPTDLAAFTSELAGVFRSAVERSGLGFTVECEALDEPVYVDRGMWEKIVLNLISNALKFTFEGHIDVTLGRAGSYVELTVSDTGTGIAAQHLPHLFRRFHRIPDARGRTDEGSGLGLSLVDEFVRVHGGSVNVTSEPGVGTSFIVRLLTGQAHLPEDRIVRDGHNAAAPAEAGTFVEDALRWLPGVTVPRLERETADVAEVAAAVAAEPATARILVADDHVDVRNYLTRLLGKRWSVEAVADGDAALEAIRTRRPDLVIADVMMPGLDGLGLLRTLREDPQTSIIPVLLLSGRAAEEERVTGLEAGAADYLSKPFSGRELVARVQTHIELSHLRAHAHLERARQLEEHMASRDAFFAAASHELRNPIHSLQLQLLALARRAEREAPAPELEWVHARLGTATKQLSRLTQLVDTLLDVSRIASGRLPLVLEDVDLAEIAADAFERLAPSEQAQITLTLTPIVGRWDRLRLDQVVTNLVSNAIKYGEGRPIDIGVSAAGERARLEVTDHGIGIAPHHQERVFERFERAVTDRRYAGFGLGLWITSRIVEEFTGTLSLRSELGVGSTFIVELPVKPKDQR